MGVLGVIFAVIAVFVVAVYLYARKQHKYWAQRGVVHEKPMPIFGNLYDVLMMKKSILEYINEVYNRYPNEPVVGFYGFTKPMIIIRDLEIIKDITIKNFDIFMNRSVHFDEVGDPLGSEMMFSKWDDEWKRVRSKMGVVFTSGKIRDMFPLINKVGKDLNQLCAKETEKGQKEVDIKDYSIRFAVDVITSCAFGAEGKAIEAPEKSVMLKALGEILHLNFKAGIAQNLMFFQRSLYCFVSRLGLGIKFFRKSLEDDLYGIVDQNSKHRLQTGERRPDIFDFIVYCNDPEFKGLAKKTGAAFQILLGGAETSSFTIFTTLYEIAKRPEVQERLQAEIQEALKKTGGEITYEVINSMEYLDNVINETLRVTPVLPFLDRIASKDYQVPGTNVVIEKGMKVFIPLWAIHMDPNFFYEPEKFIPDRFLKQNGRSYPTTAYMPFGAGPRLCFGKRFGLVVVKTFLVHFLKEYNIHTSPNTQQTLEWSKKNFTLALDAGLPVNISKAEA